MKNYFNTIIPRAQKRPGTLRVLRCHGLRNDRQNIGLRLAEHFAPIPAAKGLRPLTSMTVADKPVTILAGERTLWLIDNTPTPESVPRKIADIPSEAVEAFASDSILTVMLRSEIDKQILRFQFDGPDNIRLLPSPDEYPSLHLYSTGAGTFSAELPARQLHLYNFDIDSFRANDGRLLAQDLTRAYLLLIERARSAAAFVQPALIRYRLRNKNGATIFVSAPLLLSRDLTGFSQLVTLPTRQVTSEGLLPGTQIEADGWNVAIQMPDNFWALAPEAEKIEILASPQFHPFHPDIEPSIAMSRNQSGITVRNALPGASIGLYPDSPNNKARISNVLAVLNNAETIIGTLSRGELPDSSLRFGPRSAMASPIEEMRALDRIFKKSTDSPENHFRLCLPPNTVWMQKTASDAGIMAAIGISALRFRPFALSSLSVKVPLQSAQTFTASVAVDFDEPQETIVRTETYSGQIPDRLSPVISYPDSSARRMRFILRDDAGKIFEKSIPLKPVPGAQWAVYISENLAPIEMEQSALKTFEPFRALFRDHPFPDVVAFLSNSPGKQIHLTRTLSGHPLRAVAVLSGIASSLSFGRHRFIVSDRSGLFLASSSDSKGAIRKISPLPLERSDALCEAVDGGLYAASSENPAALMKISESGRLSPLNDTTLHGPWIAANQNLDILISSSGKALDRSDGGEYSIPSLSDTSETITIDHRPFFLRPDGSLLISADHDPDVNYPVEWIAQIDPGFPRPRNIILDFKARRAKLRLEIFEDKPETDIDSLPLVSSSVIEGTVLGPLRIPLHPRLSSVSALRIRLTGTLSPDANLRSLTL